MKKKKKILIYFNDSFWENIITNYNSPKEENIEICYNMKKLFDRYYALTNKLDGKYNFIKEDSKKLKEKKFYEILLNKNIKNFIKKENIENIDIINLIINKDEFYSKNIEQNYENKRDVEIFDKINFNTIDKDFIVEFRKCEFEILFKNDIQSYLLKFNEKIEKIEDINIILELININNLSEKDKNSYIKLLKDKYDLLINNNTSNLFENETDKKIQILVNLTKFIYENENKSLDFISDKIDKLDINIRYKIYNKLTENFDNEEYRQLGEHIVDIYFKILNIENINEFIEFLKNLPNEYQNNLYQKLLKYIIKIKDFYSSKSNIRIELLCKLTKNNLKSDNDYYNSSLTTLRKIYSLFSENQIKISDLLEFFDNSEEIISEKLNLFQLITLVDIEDIHERLKRIVLEIKNLQKEFCYIREALLRYHKESYKTEITEIKKIFDIINNGTLNEYQNERFTINHIRGKKEIAEEINKVKDSKIFSIFYKKFDCKSNIDQGTKFKKAKETYEKFIKALSENKNVTNILNDLKEQITIKDSAELEKEINKLKDLDKGSNNIDNLNEVSIVFKSKIFEEDINSIFFFFSHFKKEDEEWNKLLLNDYKDLTKNNALEKIKIYLKELKKNKIYDYEINNENNYIFVFKCLYNKTQAYDFLLTKNPGEIELLNDKIDGKNITIKDIKDTSECSGLFHKLKNMNNNFEILESMRNITEQDIKRFSNFSKKYKSIIDLDKNFDSFAKLYKDVLEIMNNANFTFYPDSEDFYYFNKKKK